MRNDAPSSSENTPCRDARFVRSSACPSVGGRKRFAHAQAWPASTAIPRSGCQTGSHCFRRLRNPASPRTVETDRHARGNGGSDEVSGRTAPGSPPSRRPCRRQGIAIDRIQRHVRHVVLPSPESADTMILRHPIPAHPRTLAGGAATCVSVLRLSQGCGGICGVETLTGSGRLVRVHGDSMAGQTEQVGPVRPRLFRSRCLVTTSESAWSRHLLAARVESGQSGCW